MNKSIRRIWNVISIILVVIVVALTILLVGVRLIGLQPYAVLSGSMEPTYHTGALIYVKKIQPQEVEVGDPITFVLDDQLNIATHRVIRIDDANRHFYTKGDANEFADASPVHYNNLIGKPVFTIPYLGYLSAYVKDPPGRYIALAAAAVLLLLVFLLDLFDGEKKKEKKSGASGRVESSAAGDHQDVGNA